MKNISDKVGYNDCSDGADDLVGSDKVCGDKIVIYHFLDILKTNSEAGYDDGTNELWGQRFPRKSWIIFQHLKIFN